MYSLLEHHLTWFKQILNTEINQWCHFSELAHTFQALYIFKWQLTKFISFFSGMTAISTYFLTKELWSAGAGLFAACFIAIVPGYISRSVAGSYDNEGIAIFALQFTYYLWIKSVKTGSVFWSVAASLSYFYMVSTFLCKCISFSYNKYFLNCNTINWLMS